MQVLVIIEVIPSLSNKEGWFRNILKLPHECKNGMKCTASPNIIRVIKSTIMRWAGHVARSVGWSGVNKVLVGEI